MTDEMALMNDFDEMSWWMSWWNDLMKWLDEMTWWNDFEKRQTYMHEN